MSQNQTTARLFLFTLLAASLSACTPNLNEDDGYTSGSKDGGVGVSSVSANSPALAPLQATIGLGGNLVLQVSGGAQPYTYSVSPARGSVSATSASSATYQASTTEGVVQVTVTDALGNSSQSSVNVSASAGAAGALQMSPSSASVVGGTTLAFSASNGRAPYTYSVVTASGGAFASNVFTATRALQTVTVKVTDSAGATAQATLTITMSADCSGGYTFQGSSTSGTVAVASYNAATGAITGWIKNSGGDKAHLAGTCSLANGKGAFSFRLTDASGQGSGTFQPNAAGKLVITGTNSGGDLGNGTFTATQM